MSDLLCPCQSADTYVTCCGPLHRGRPAPDAARLMRARFCAYAVAQVDYIVATTYVGGRAHQTDLAAWRHQIRTFSRTTDFGGLTILDSREAGRQAWVTFCAQLKRGPMDASFCEESHFCLDTGRWLYEGGDALPMPDRPICKA